MDVSIQKIHALITNVIKKLMLVNFVKFVKIQNIVPLQILEKFILVLQMLNVIVHQENIVMLLLIKILK